MSGSYRVIAPDRYLRILPFDAPVTLVREGRPLFDAPSALQLAEGDRDRVWYLPIESVPDGMLLDNGGRYHCRWKGEAIRFDVRLDDVRLADVAWCYRDGPDDVAALRDHVAFDVTAFEVVSAG